MATELFKLMGRITIEMDDAESALRRFDDLLTNAVTALQSIDTKLTTVNTTLNTMDTRLSDANTELKDLDSKATSAKTAVNALDGEVDSLNGSMNTMDSRVNDVVNELKELDSKSKTAGAEISTLDGKLSKLQNPFSADGALGAGAVWLGNVLEDLVYKALDLSWEFMKIGINFNASAETYRASFKTMLGVTEKEAEVIYERLRQFAVDTPYSMAGVADSAVRLFNAGYDVDSTLEMLEVFGNIANGDSAKMERLVKAWTDVKGYGRLRAQERNQFVENGVMIDQLLADYYQSQGINITSDQIMAKLEAKEVAQIDVLNALIMSQMEGGNFYRAMANIMDTYSGQMEKTGDQLDETAGAFTMPFFDTLKDETLPKLSELLVELKTWSEDNQDTLGELATALSGTATTVLDDLLGLFTFLVERKDALIPILQVIGGAFAFSYAADHPLIAVLGALTAMAQNDPVAFDELLTSLSELSTALLDFANGAFKTLSEIFANDNGTESVTGWFTSVIDMITEFLDFITKEEGRIQGAMVLLGALAMATGHPVAGLAILGTVYPQVWDNYKTSIVDPIVEDPAGAVESAQNNLQNGTTVLHYMTGTGAYSEGEQEYSRNTTPYERAVLWAASFFDDDVKRKVEERFGLIDEDEGEEEDNKGGTSGSLDQLRYNMHNQAMQFASANGMPERGGDYGFSTFDGRGGVLASVSGAMASGGIVGLIASVQGLTAAVQSMTGEIPSAISAGVGNISVTGTVTTGNVVLDTGAIVGQIAPRMNLVLGGLNSISGRG